MDILCFGDSNTNGYEPGTGNRYDKNTRWTGILQNKLGDKYNIIEEGFNGRTISMDIPEEPEKNGIYCLMPCLRKHKKIDLMMIMLGTNDIVQCLGLTAREITLSLSNMIDIIKRNRDFFTNGKVNILILAPVPCKKGIDNSDKDPNGASSYQKSVDIVTLYEDLAKEKNCHFFNPSLYVKTSDIDFVHLDKDAHKILGDEIYKKLKTCI